MKLQNEKFTANITAVDTKSLNFDNQRFIYFEENIKNEFSKSHIISVDTGTKTRQIILVGDLFLYSDYCAVLEDEILTVLQNDILVQINLSTCKIAKQKQIEEFGGNFELHLIPTGYLVYGESAVAAYDKDLNQIWSFSGRDIFVSSGDGSAFKVEKETITIHDFQGNFYELDFSGKVIKEICK